MASSLTVASSAVVFQHILDEAVAQGRLKQAMELLRFGFSVCTSNYIKKLHDSSENNETPLQIAWDAWIEIEENTKSALEDKLLNERLLVEAAARGDVQTVTKLLELGVNVDADGYNKTLCLASANYWTPLQIACAYNHVGCAKILLANRANKNAKDRFDVTAMHLSAEKGYISCLDLLLSANAECSIPSTLDGPYPNGTTPLHLAAKGNYVECVEKLIQYGADYNAVDKFGRSSLYIASKHFYSSCVLVHLRTAVGRDILALPSKASGNTPLHFAVRESMIECIEELLKSGSSVNHLNQVGLSPLHVSVISELSVNREYRRLPRSCRFMNAAYHNDNYSTYLKRRCLDARQKTKMILEMLIQKGYDTDINLPSRFGYYTALHYVSYSRDNSIRRPELMKFLISYGANVHIKIKVYPTWSNVPARWSVHWDSFCPLTLLQFELLSHSEDFEVLRYIVRSLLHPPRLSRFIAIPHLPPAMPHALFPYGHEMSENESIVWGDMLNLYSTIIRDPQLPVENFNTRTLYLEDTDSEVEDEGLFTSKEEVTSWIDKHVWYVSVASNPRTLQHYCRYAIRQALGPSSMKHINRLPLPKLLKSYVLLEYGD